MHGIYNILTLDKGNKNMKIKNLIFDVDGTLWDSSSSVAASWNRVLQRYDETKHIHLTQQDEYRFMGHTMTEIAEMMLPGLPDARRTEIMDACMADENAYLMSHPGEFYDGLSDTWKVLHRSGKNLYIVSNCQDGYIQAMLTGGHFTYEEAADGGIVPRDIQDFECFGRTGKKKGDNIKILMDRNGLIAEETVYIGDTEMDETAAREAGVRFIHATYGFGTAKAPDAVIHDIRELPNCIKNQIL
jgi:phosphoglycolate phosphatase